MSKTRIATKVVVEIGVALIAIATFDKTMRWVQGKI